MQNRELQIMRLVGHPNVVELKAFFYSNGERVRFLNRGLVPDRRLTPPQQKKDEVYLNLVLEFVPETVYRASRHYAKMKQTMPIPYIKLCVAFRACAILTLTIARRYMYQLRTRSPVFWLVMSSRQVQ